MKLTLEVDPSQIFINYLCNQDVYEIVSELLKQQCLDDRSLWNIISMVLDTLVTDYQSELESYTERQLKASFENDSSHKGVDPELVNEAQRYLDAAVKIRGMVKFVYDEVPENVSK